jgi:hypothetical protein
VIAGRAYSWYLTNTLYRKEDKFETFEDALEHDPRCLAGG